MASKVPASAALFLSLNLLFFAVVSGCNTGCPSPTPKPPKPTPTPSFPGKCPINTLKLGVCANLLQGLIKAKVGKPPKEPCCGLINGLVDLEAAVCLCTAIKANVLGIKLNLPVSLTLLVNYCGKKVPKGFHLVLFSLVSGCPVCPHKPPTPRPPTPNPPTPIPPPSDDSCAKQGHKFAFCADLLGGLIGIGGGILKPLKLTCCPLLPGVLDVEGAVCLCTVIKFRFLNIPIDIPVSFVKLFNYCGKSAPKGGCNTCPHQPRPIPTPSTPSSTGKCPVDTLKLGVCANVLSGLIKVGIGKPPKTPCCPLLQGLVDVEAAVCLCTAIKAGILGIHLDIPLSLSLLLNYCGKGVPKGF
ncbi:hypothetical protein Taro_055220, partial [Colocasia esculenta]|nr:hypothetical protein [Colocasia esculenta]